MEIIVAKTAGFCFGVERAVDLAFKQVGKEGTYTFGPIIHNDAVINRLKDANIAMTTQIDEQTEIKQLIIRSHGVEPAIYEKAKQHGAEVVDATCPYVKKIHKLVAKHSKEGEGIIIVGNMNHPEVQGINGWTNHEALVVEGVHELENIQLDRDKKYYVVAQTTYKKSVFDQVIQYLQNKGYQINYQNTICAATKERQEEATQLARQVDAMIVIGGKQSSNTTKLYEVAHQVCHNTYCIEGASEVYEEMLKGCNKVGVTAGASTPDWVIAEVVDKIKKMNTH